MSSGYRPPPPPPVYKPTAADRWRRLKLWQKVVIPIGVLVFLAAAISVAVEGDPEPTNEAKDEPTSEPAATSEAPSPKPSESKPAKVTPAGDGFGAEVACEEFIERRGGGDYDFSKQEHSEDGKLWDVTGVVELDDGDALYRCKIEQTSGDQWTLRDLFVDR